MHAPKPIPPDELRQWFQDQRKAHGRWHLIALIYHQLRCLKAAIVEPRPRRAEGIPILRWTRGQGATADGLQRHWILESDDPFHIQMAHINRTYVVSDDWTCKVGDGRTFRATGEDDAKHRVRQIMIRNGWPADLLPNS